MKEITQVTKHLRPGVTPCRKVEEPVLVIKMALNLNSVALSCQWGIWSFCFRKLTTTILISTNGSIWTNSRKVASRPKSTRQFLFTTIANKYQQENVAFFDAAFNFQTPINPMPYHPIQYCKHFDVLPKKWFWTTLRAWKGFLNFLQRWNSLCTLSRIMVHCNHLLDHPYVIL